MLCPPWPMPPPRPRPARGGWRPRPAPRTRAPPWQPPQLAWTPAGFTQHCQPHGGGNIGDFNAALLLVMFTLWTRVTQYLLELETKAYWGLLLDCEGLNIAKVCFQTSCISSGSSDHADGCVRTELEDRQYWSTGY